MPEYIARISYGKDSLKMLDVIITRGLPLDRVTTTDVWATDTIPAELPPVLEAKARIEEKLWQMYRINVDHLCARNKDGSKKTYEQMFYHVPVRRSQSVQVERERERRAPARLDLRLPNSLAQMVSNCPQTVSRATECRGRSPDSLPTPDTTTARSSSCRWMQYRGFRCLAGLGAREDSNPECRPQGFPAQISPWCRKLKIDKVKTPPLQ